MLNKLSIKEITTIRVSLISFISVIIALMSYATIQSPFNRISIGIFDGTHTYTIAIMLLVPIYGLLKNVSMIRAVISLPIYAAIHEIIWVGFDILAYPVMVTLTNEFRITNVLWLAITTIVILFGLIKFDYKSKILFTIFILFNLVWVFGFGYANTLAIMPNGSHPLAFNLTANAFEWFYTILFTAIFIKVFKWN